MRAKLIRIGAAILLAVCIAACFTGCVSGSAKRFDLSGGVPEGWNEKIYYASSGSAEVVRDARFGSAVHITASQPNDARLTYRIKAKDGYRYTLSCYVKTAGVEEGAGANVGVYGTLLSSDGVYGDTDWTEVVFSVTPDGVFASDGWKPNTVAVDNGSGEKEIELAMGLGGHGSLTRGEAWFADVRLTQRALFPVNELLLCSAAGLLLLVIILLLHRYFAKKPYKPVEKSYAAAVIGILAAAFIVRIVIALFITGHKTDINCFVFWGRRVAEAGPAVFYDTWCDYPPGYMLVLGLMAKIGSLFKLSDISLLIKLPAMIADIVTAYLVYVYAKRRMSFGAAITLMAFVAFTPVLAYISAGWGQIDQVLSLLLVVPILLLYDRKPIWAGVVYGLAIIVKPQALMAGPLFAAAYLLYVIKGNPYKKFAVGRGLARFTRVKTDNAGHRFAETVFAVLGAVAVIVAVSLPFTGSQPWHWLLDKYYGTATSYDYATVNAYNFWAFIGANWKSTSLPFMGATYGQWGTRFMAAAVLLSIAAYVFAVLKHKNCKGALPLVMAFLFAAIFTFGHFMHERYVFPVLTLLVFAYIFYNDRRILWSYVLYASTLLLNCLAAFYYAENIGITNQNGDRSLIFNDGLIQWCSLANLLAFILLAYITIDLVIRNKPYKGYNG